MSLMEAFRLRNIFGYTQKEEFISLSKVFEALNIFFKDFEHKTVNLSVCLWKMYFKWTLGHDYSHGFYWHVYCEKMLSLKICYCEMWSLVTADVWNRELV